MSVCLGLDSGILPATPPATPGIAGAICASGLASLRKPSSVSEPCQASILRLLCKPAENTRRRPAPVEQTNEGADDTPKPSRIWDRDLLEKQVWSEPIRQLAKKYGVSDVAIHKRCKKMGIKLPGRGYWAKKVSHKEP